MRHWVSGAACIALAGASLAVSQVAARAGDLHLQPGIFSDPDYNPTVTVGASISEVNGSATEFVFQNAGATKLSELDWKINNVTMLNASLGFRLTPWLAFRLEGGTKVTGTSHLDDSDWLYHGPNIRDMWSDSPDTTVKSANQVDASSTLALYRQPNFTVNAIAGLRWTQWDFEATGGTFIYSKDASHLNNWTGNLPDVAGITYSQQMVTPYLGLGLSATLGRFGLNASATGSDWVFAHTYDQHHTRMDISPTGGLFNDSMHGGQYYDVKIGGSYAFNDRVSLTADWEREDFLLVKGETNIYPIGTGINGTGGSALVNRGGPASGMDNSTDKVTVGVTYKLE